MAPPIGPNTIKPGDIGEEHVVLGVEHRVAIKRAREVFTDTGSSVATEFSPSEIFNEKVDAGRDSYYVFGACNLSMANRTLDATDKKTGGLFPCNVAIWEGEPGKQVIYHLSIMRVAQLIGIVPDDDKIADIITGMGELAEQALANLDATGA